MPEPTRAATRLEPSTAWTLVTESPLLGLSLAREAGVLLAWDEGRRLELYDYAGERVLSARAPERIVTAAISDDGGLVAVLLEGPRLLLLSGELEPMADRPTISEAHALSVDPHGRYVVVASKASQAQFYTKYGKTAGKFTTPQAIAHARFVPDRPMLVGASVYGSLFGIDLDARGTTLSAEIDWQQRMLSGIGRLAVTGDGGMILASCYTHGVQRYDARGHNEGSYHLGGTASHAVPDFAGRLIAVATTEGELSILNSGGNVRWKTQLPRGPNALEFDALGRHLYYGMSTGEVTRIDLDGRRTEGRPAAREGSPQRCSAGMRRPEWTIPVAVTEDQAETAVVAVLDDPPRIGVITSSNRLQVFTTTGGDLGQAPDIAGVGRIIRTAPGWFAAATDRQIVLYDARRNAAQRVDLNLVETTHLVIRPDTYGLAVVQERDRVGRASVAGRWVWKRELRSAVEEVVVGADALTALTCDDGTLMVFDPSGEPCGRYTVEPDEPMLLALAPAGAASDVLWITLARRQQVLRGHKRDGRVAWESPIPWEAWQMHTVGAAVVIEAPDGRALMYDGAGHQRGQTRNESPPGVFFEGRGGAVERVVRQGMHLICSDLSGRVQWRAIAEENLGPVGAGRPGVAAIIGRSAAWFPTLEIES